MLNTLPPKLFGRLQQAANLLNNCAIGSSPSAGRTNGTGLRLHPALLAIAGAALGRSVPAPAGGSPPPSGADQDKLLAEIRQTQGPAGLLLAGQNIATSTGEPLVLSLLNSENPGVLFDKIVRFNRYFHSHHRHRVIDLGPRHADIEHRSVSGPPPTADQSLFVCGLYLALTERIGCRRVECAFPQASTGSRKVYVDGVVDGAPSDNTGRWLITWVDVAAARVLPDLDEILLRNLPVDLETLSVSDQAVAILSTDLSRTWRVDDLATRLALSPRTLQRRLRDEGASFSRLLSRVRVDEAARLLRTATASIGEIGYTTGFADTAHFTRTFKRATGSTPTEWRESQIGTGGPGSANPTRAGGHP